MMLAKLNVNKLLLVFPFKISFFRIFQLKYQSITSVIEVESDESYISIFHFVLCFADSSSSYLCVFTIWQRNASSL